MIQINTAFFMKKTYKIDIERSHKKSSTILYIIWYQIVSKRKTPQYLVVFSFLSYIMYYGGKRWIRTTEDEVDGFTVRCIWPLCNLPNGASEGNRTPNLLITSQLLYR